MNLWEKLQALAAQAAAKLEEIRDLEPSEVTAEMHAEVDRIYNEAADVREEIDKQRSVAQLEQVAGARAELSSVGEWALASGYLGGLPPATGDANNPQPEEPFVRIHRIAAELYADESRSQGESFVVDMEGARLQSALIRAGITPSELAVHAQRGTLAGMVQSARAARGTVGDRDHDEADRALVQATLTTTVLTPTLFATTLYDYMEYLGGLRRAGATYTSFTRGNTMTFWANRGHAAQQAAVAQGTAVADAEDTYSSYTISTATYGGKAFLSRELIEDAGPAGLVDIVGNDVGRVAGRSAEAAYHTVALESPANAGDIPLHYARTLAKTDSAAGDIKFPTGADAREALVDLLFELDETYIMGDADWLMPKSVYKLVTLINIANIGYPYMMDRGSAAAGSPFMVEGHPVGLDAFFPTIPAASGSGDQYGVAAFAVGNWRDAFHIADVGGVRVDMSTEYKFAERLVTIMGWIRTGGAIRDPRAAELWCAKTKT